MHRRWAKVARPTITRHHAHSKCIRWLDVIDIPTATYPTMPRCWANMLPSRPSPDIAHTKIAYICPTLARRRHPSATNLTMCPRLANTAWPTITQRCALSDLNAYAGPTLARHRHSNCDPSDNAPTLGQICPADHHPASRTLRMHAYIGSTSKFRPRPILPCTGIGPTLPGRPLPDFTRHYPPVHGRIGRGRNFDVEPTYAFSVWATSGDGRPSNAGPRSTHGRIGHGRNINVEPKLGQHMHFDCLRSWVIVDRATLAQSDNACTGVGPRLPGRPSPDVAHTKNAYVGQTLA